MINARILGVLVVVSAIVLVAVIYSQQNDRYAPEKVGNFFADLIKNVNQVAKVQITTADGVVSLIKQESEWAVKQKDNYPASSSKVRALILGLAELRRLEPKTKNPGLYSKLGLADLTEQGSRSMLIQLQDQNEADIAALVVGNHKRVGTAGNRSQYYVRLPFEPQAWLTEGQIPLDRTPGSWIDNQVMAIEPHEIQSVTVIQPDDEQLRIYRENKTDENYKLLTLDEGEEVESAYSINNIARTLKSLTADDVMPMDTIKFAEKPVQARIDTFDGLRINVSIYKQDDKHYAHLSATATSGGSETSTAHEKAGTLNDHWHKWTYMIPDYQVDAVTIKKVDLIKKQNRQSEPKS